MLLDWRHPTGYCCRALPPAFGSSRQHCHLAAPRGPLPYHRYPVLRFMVLYGLFTEYTAILGWTGGRKRERSDAASIAITGFKTAAAAPCLFHFCRCHGFISGLLITCCLLTCLTAGCCGQHLLPVSSGRYSCTIAPVRRRYHTWFGHYLAFPPVFRAALLYRFAMVSRTALLCAFCCPFLLTRVGSACCCHPALRFPTVIPSPAGRDSSYCQRLIPAQPRVPGLLCALF